MGATVACGLHVRQGLIHARSTFTVCFHLEKDLDVLEEEEERRAYSGESRITRPPETELLVPHLIFIALHTPSPSTDSRDPLVLQRGPGRPRGSRTRLKPRHLRGYRNTASSPR